MQAFYAYMLRIALVLFWALPAFADGGGTVCRNKYIGGMEQRIDRVGAMLGATTTDLSAMKLYVGMDGNVPFIQSNYLSPHPDRPGEFSEYPTKIRASGLTDLHTALKNIMFWKTLPENADASMLAALGKATIFVDEAIIKPNGEMPFDVSGANNIRIVRDTQIIDTGKIVTLPLLKPPPALIETLSGCCLKGRPPGRREAILGNLKKRSFDPSEFTFLPFVADSGTHAVVRQSPELSRSTLRTTKPGATYEVQLTEALQRSKGRNLIVLAHIEKADVVVRDSRNGLVFSIPIATLREKAKALNVDLILLGCDTASFVSEASQGLGIAGKFNSVKAVRLLEGAVKSSFSVGDLVGRMASKDLTMVAYEESGGHGFAGASGFAKVRDSKMMARVFRVLALKNWGLNGPIAFGSKQ